MFIYRERGGLQVAEMSQDEKTIAAELKAMDRRLVLNRNPDESGRFCWDVHCIWSSDHPAVLICTWRDDNGNPLPLSSGLVEKVKSLRSGVDTAAQAELANQRLREANRKDAHNMFQDWGSDVLPSLDDKRSVLLHRGQHLRRSRDKQRALGDKGA